MGFIYALRSDTGKNEAYIVLGYSFLCTPLWGHCYFLLTYSQYASTADSKKLKMILEITTAFFPVLISVIVGLNVALEKKRLHTSKRACCTKQTQKYACKINLSLWFGGYLHCSFCSCYL